jgi:outer membrane cobalamin receptor
MIGTVDPTEINDVLDVNSSTWSSSKIKQYTESLVQGLDVKKSVKVATSTSLYTTAGLNYTNHNTLTQIDPTDGVL